MEEIENNRALIEELTKAYNDYLSAMEKTELVLNEKEEKVKEAIEIIAKEYADSINERMKEEENTKMQFDNYINLVSKYSTFDIDSIGKSIARIVSEAEGKCFRFGNVISQYDITCYDMCSEPYIEKTREIDSIIVETSKYEENYWQQNGKNMVDELERDGHAIILKKNGWWNEQSYEITFLNIGKECDINFNINFKDFDYINDFIIELVQYRFQRNLDKITQEDINLVVEEFIPKAKETKIKNRILVLKKELDSLTKQIG